MTEHQIPHRKLSPGKLVIASHNAGKVREIAELLGPHGIEPVSAGSLGLPEPEETGTTFIANAGLKALAAADLSGLPALADDSGLSSVVLLSPACASYDQFKNFEVRGDHFRDLVLTDPRVQPFQEKA